MAITPLPSLDRTAPTFKTDVDLFFGSQLPQFSTQAESARVAITGSESAAAASAALATEQKTAAAASASQAAADRTQTGLDRIAASDSAAAALSSKNAAQIARAGAEAAAAAAHGGIKAYATKSEAAIAAALLPDGQDIEVSQDETRAGARTRYKVQAGALVFVVNLDQTKLDLAAATGASLVGFQQEGTGAVSTTVQDKMRDSVSVKDFGAKGDGVADDTTAFSNAINSGKRVYAPSGAYLLSTLLIPSNTYIYGDGDTTVIKPLTAATAFAIGADSGSSSAQIENITIRDIQFLGYVTTAGFSEHLHLVHINGVHNVLVDNCLFSGFRGDGIYLGSGFVLGDERHNTDVVIRNCRFDGVNNDNRNAISVIDCNGLTIESSSFKRCTRSDMPGAIDIEPDAYAFAVINNITIRNNTFASTCGGAADIQFYLPKAFGNPGAPHYAMTTLPDNFLLEGNHHDLKADASHSAVVLLLFNNTIGNVTRQWKPNNIRVVNNSFKNAVSLGGTRGAVVSNNVFSGNSLMVVGSEMLNTGKAFDTMVSDNLFTDMGLGYGATAIGNSSGTQVRGNTYVNIAVNEASKFGIVLIGSAATTESDDLVIADNKFFGTFTAHIKWNGSQVYAPASTVVYGNLGPSSIFGNAITVDLPNGYRQHYASMNELIYATATLPDSFPVGTTSCVANDDAGLPSTFKQGILITNKVASDLVYRKFSVQQFFPAYNDVATGKDWYFRKGDPGINAWVAWSKVTGV